MPLLRPPRCLAFRGRVAAFLLALSVATPAALSVAAPAVAAPLGGEPRREPAPAGAEQPGGSSRAKPRVAQRRAAVAGGRARAAGRTGQRTKKDAERARPTEQRAAKRREDGRGERGGNAGNAGVDDRKPLSKGAPNRGRLFGAVRLRSSRHVKVRKDARAWGLPVLVQALRRAAFQVAKKHGDSALLVGDLSAKGGGPLDGHNSHQSGRDADVGFYVVDAKGRSLRTDRFVAFDDRGNAIGIPGARFDDKRNWALVEALLEDRRARVKYLFVADALRARLLAYAAKRRVPETLRARAAAAMMSARSADPHNDHFHIRVACPPSMRGVCIEESLPRSPRSRRACSTDAASKADAASKTEEAAAPAPAKSGGADAATAPAPAKSDRTGAAPAPAAGAPR